MLHFQISSLFIFLVPTTYDLAGIWMIAGKDNSWRCAYVSKTVVNCKGRNLTLNGNTVAWASGGDNGTIRKSGGKNYNTITWSYSNWIEQGKRDRIICILFKTTVIMPFLLVYLTATHINCYFFR